MNPALSVIIITKEEEGNIAACLESVRWADEIILVDAESRDRTVEIARAYTPHIFIRAWEGYAAAKQFALERVSHSWVLWIDADERATPELSAEIQRVIAQEDSFSGYRVARRAYFLGTWIRHCGWYPGYVVRLFRKEKGRFTERLVHEQLDVAGPIGTLTHDLLHFTDSSIEQYFEKFNHYTTLAAEQLAAEGRRASLGDLLIRPSFLFFKMYVLRLGFLDGIHGLLLCLFSAAYVLTKYAKRREIQMREHMSAVPSA